MTARPLVRFRIWSASEPIVLEAGGQTARALLALVEAGAGGVTALEVSTWAYRLAAYVWDLKSNYGLAIRTDREDHPGGWHGRYTLETPIQIIEVTGAAFDGEAA